MLIRLIILGLCLSLSVNAKSFRNCATDKLVKKKFKPIHFRQLSNLCSPESYYDSVYTKRTEHFALIYTLTGPHAVKKSFLDSVAITLEKAYKRFTKEHKTKMPLGEKVSYHFQQKIPDNLYPVEILEMDLLRDIHLLLGESNCRYCMGLTIPSSSEKGASSIILDNNFKHASAEPQLYYFEKEGTKCAYPVSDFSLENKTQNYSYDENFDAGIRITIFHELYHAIQLRYLDLNEHYTYWFETSASGMEEILAPDVNDYISYTAPFFKMNWDSFANISNPYALSPFFIAAYQKWGKEFDTKIWESYLEFPEDPFEFHLSKILTNQKLDPFDEFHNIAEILFFSGKEQIYSNDSLPSDITLWDKPNVFPKSKEISQTNFPYFTYRYSKNYPTENGRVSYFLKNSTDSTFSLISIKSFEDYKKNYQKIQNADSSILIFSRLKEAKENYDSTTSQKKLLAYPNPYRGMQNLCFEGLSQKSATIEIRNRKGNLVLLEKHEGNFHCINFEKIKSKLSPGLYLYREGNSGKMKKLLYVQ